MVHASSAAQLGPPLCPPSKKKSKNASTALLGGRGLGLLHGLGLERLGEKGLDLFALDLDVAEDALGSEVRRRGREADGTRLGDGEGHKDLRGEVRGDVGGTVQVRRIRTEGTDRKEVRRSNVRDLVGLEEVVLDALLDAHASHPLVLEHAKGEGERAGFALDFGKGGAGRGALEEVRRRRLLVHRRPGEFFLELPSTQM